MSKEDSIKALIDAIQKRDFGVFKNALPFARQEKINVFEISSFLKASEGIEDVRDAMSLFSYLIFAGSENRLNDLPKWLNLMLETLDVEWNDTNKYDFSPYCILALAQRHDSTFFTREMMYECLESLSRHVDINETDSSGQNVLVYVLKDKEIAKLYLTFGADPNGVDRKKNLYAETPLGTAILARQNIEIVKLLLEHKADPNTMIIGNTEGLNLLVKYGADTEMKDIKFRTAALQAAIADDNMLLDTLLEAGADMFATSENDYNIFHLPASANIANVIKIVMKHAEKRGVVSEAVKTLNARSRWDETPLYYHVRRIIHQKSERFASSDSVDMMKVITAFCDSGADINSRNSNGQTVLHLLSNFLRRENSNLNMTEGDEWIRGVIRLGAEVNAQDNDGKTPLIVMGKRLKDKTITADGFWKIAFPLLEAGADVEIKNNEGNDVFYYLDEEMNRRIRDYQEWEKISAQDLEQDLFERN